MTTENGDVNMATQVMLDLLLSADPNADIVLVRRFCVAFNTVSGITSSLNPLFLILSLSADVSLILQLMSPATAVQVKLAVPLTTMLTDFGGIIISTRI